TLNVPAQITPGEPLTYAADVSGARVGGNNTLFASDRIAGAIIDGIERKTEPSFSVSGTSLGASGGATFSGIVDPDLLTGLIVGPYSGSLVFEIRVIVGTPPGIDQDKFRKVMLQAHN